MTSEVVDAIQGIGKAFDEFKAVNDAAQAKTDKRLAELQDRIEAEESLRNRPSASVGGGESVEQREHRQKFIDWLRNPRDRTTLRAMDEAEAWHKEQRTREGKDVAIGSNASGGYAVPTSIDAEIEKRARVLNPFRSLVRVVEVGSRDHSQLVSTNDSTSGWVGETDSRNATTTSELRQRKPTFGTLYAYPKATEEAMQDVFFNVQEWLVTETAENFAAAEAAAIVSGNGTSRPTGFLYNAPVATEDASSPERGADVLQYIAPTASSPTVTLTSLADALVDVVYKVKDNYLADPSRVAWVMRRETGAKIRKLKESSTNQYLWQPGLAAGQPDTLLGYPVHYSNAMPAIANDACPIAFGNWARGYLLADRVGTMRITVDDNITTPGYTKFYVRRVVGGCVLNNEALKVLKVTD